MFDIQSRGSFDGGQDRFLSPYDSLALPGEELAFTGFQQFSTTPSLVEISNSSASSGEDFFTDGVQKKDLPAVPPPLNYPIVSREDLRFAMNKEMGAVQFANPTPLFEAEYSQKVTQTVDWIDQSLGEFLQTTSWENRNVVKISNKGFSIRCIKKANDIYVFISLGTFARGGDKSIKSVLFLKDNQILRIVRATVSKFLNDETFRSKQLLQIKREKLAREAQIGDALLQAKVPSILPLTVFSKEIDGAVENIYFMPRYERTLATYVCAQQALVKPIGRLFSKPFLKRVLPLLLDILQGLSAMHKAGWVHGDLKPSNVFVTENIPVLADFSCTKRVNTCICYLGTTGYIAPEFLASHSVKLIRPEVDLWSFGVLLLECTHSKGELFKQIERKGIEAIQEYTNSISSECKIKLQMQISRTAEELDHAIEKFQKKLQYRNNPLKLLIRDLLSRNPNERPTADQTGERLRSLLTTML